MIQIKDQLFSDCLSEISEVERAEFELSFSISDKIASILKSQHMTQRDLAKLTGKRESEVSKWLTGRHNFTMKTIALISTHLGQPLVDVH